MINDYQQIWRKFQNIIAHILLNRRSFPKNRTRFEKTHVESEQTKKITSGHCYQMLEIQFKGKRIFNRMKCVSSNCKYN